MLRAAVASRGLRRSRTRLRAGGGSEAGNEFQGAPWRSAAGALNGTRGQKSRSYHDLAVDVATGMTSEPLDKSRAGLEWELGCGDPRNDLSPTSAKGG
jgi:hypothetical protein